MREEWRLLLPHDSCRRLHNVVVGALIETHLCMHATVTNGSYDLVGCQSFTLFTHDQSPVTNGVPSWCTHCLWPGMHGLWV
jgi:hypothetical protein